MATIFHQDDLRQLRITIEKASSIAICGHSSPDGDCLGSCFAFGEYLQKYGKQVHYFTPDQPTAYYAFHPLTSTVNAEAFVPDQYDLIICLDVANQERSVLAPYTLTQLQTPVIIIDHHHTNSFKDCLILVDEHTSSCCEIVYSILTQHTQKQEITPSIATNLLMGIITDTGNFMRGCSPESALRTAAELLELGAKKQWLLKHLYQSNSLQGVQFYETILKRTTRDSSGAVIWTYYTDQELAQQGLSQDAVEGAYGVIRSIRHDGCFVLFKVVTTLESGQGHIKCSFRTSSPSVDVSAIAATFGGGGHKGASGAKLFMETDYLDQIKRVVATIADQVKTFTAL